MKRSLIAVLCLFAFAYIHAAANEGVEGEILAVLREQQKQWNEGSIEGFMAYYWKSEEFTFQSGARRLHGWSELFEMYRKNYSGENRGTLTFDEIEVTILSGDAAFVLGRWKVTREDSAKEGLFTLIFRKTREGWRIIHDHSS